MNKMIGAIALVTAVSSLSSINAFAEVNDGIKNVSKYDVNVSKSLYVPYEKSTSQLFPDGFVTGFGSAVTFKGFDKNGNAQFYAITDRGPNADAPNYKEGDTVSASKIFPNASFTPSIGILTITDGVAKITEQIELKNSKGENITGLPLEGGLIGSTGEVALDMDLNNLGYDADGLDTEGIAVDKEGNFYVCDEYGPFIAKFDKTGKLIKKYAPTVGLPEVLKYRIPNRGFEGLTISPSGKIFASMQSVLDIEGETSKTASFTRIIELDPITGDVKTYAYPVSVLDYSSPKNCKIGDIYAISDTSLLVIEQGELKDKTMTNFIYTLDLSGAEDITNKKVNGQYLEYVTDANELSKIGFGKKEKLIDLRSLGWTAEKAEGICLYNDNKTIAVINDNDFGLMMNVTDSTNENPNITDYTYDAITKKFYIDSKEAANVKIDIKQNTEPAQIWTIEMEKAL